MKRGNKAFRRANLELVWLKNVFSNAVRIGLISASPVAEVKPLPMSREQKEAQQEKRRYVSDDDYDAMLQVASPSVWVAMEISYCTGCRQGDVLSLRWDNVKDYLEIKEGKTGHAYKKILSPKLKSALEKARTLKGHPFKGYVVRDRRGEKYTSDGFQANWKRYKAKLSKSQQFTFHEIRHKAISDAKKKRQFSQHADKRMVKVYDHETPISPSH